MPAIRVTLFGAPLEVHVSLRRYYPDLRVPLVIVTTFELGNTTLHYDVVNAGAMALCRGDYGDDVAAQDDAVAARFVRDVFRAMDLIFTRYPREANAYAQWYAQAHRGEETYERAVTHTACRLIKHHHITDPRVHWELVQFPA
jgi:hypothetical protein